MAALSIFIKDPSIDWIKDSKRIKDGEILSQQRIGESIFNREEIAVLKVCFRTQCEQHADNLKNLVLEQALFQILNNLVLEQNLFQILNNLA